MVLFFGVIIYVALMAGFMSFGKFLKDCDATMFEDLKTDSFIENPSNSVQI